MKARQRQQLNVDESASTRNLIKLAAQRLFSHRGVDGVSVRDIVEAAGQKNSGALHYYFGTKDELVAEIVADGAREIDRRRIKLLDGLSETTAEISVKDLVSILVYPGVGLASEGEPDTYAKFITMLQLNHRDIFIGALEGKYNQGYRRCLDLLRDRLSHLPKKVLSRRLVYLDLFINAVLSARESFLTKGVHHFWSDPQILEGLIGDASSMLLAPLSLGEMVAEGASARPKIDNQKAPKRKSKSNS